MSDYTIERKARLSAQKPNTGFSLYPIDMASFLMTSPPLSVDVLQSGGGDPMDVAPYALALWNRDCVTDAETTQFLALAHWLVEHEVLIGDDFSGWPTTRSHPSLRTSGSWLSARTQGCVVSVLTRAYQVTHEDLFLNVAERAVRTFTHDILDGGIQSPVGSSGLFFEEVAVYPATHHFDGFVYAMVGLYDYCALRPANGLNHLMQRALETLRGVIAEFDTGFWTYTDLTHRQLTSSIQLFRQIHLLEVLAEQSADSFYATVAARWTRYRVLPGSRRRASASRLAAYGRRALLEGIRHTLLPSRIGGPSVRVSVPLNSLATGGILTVLRGVTQVTKDIWTIEYLTRYVDLDEKGYSVHLFGSAMMAPWQFPTVWVYMWDGFRKILMLARQGRSYDFFLPQDGVFTAAATGLAAKITGARTVCIDHANLTLVDNDIYREERKKALLLKPFPWRILSGVLLKMYWPTLKSIAHLSARVVDHFLVPGVVGDGVEEICQGFGIPQSRLTRFDSMINVKRHIVFDASERAGEREKKGLLANAIVVAIICRLSSEKGLEIALASIQQTLAMLEPADKARLRVVIAGDGPLRESLEEDVRRRDLGGTCLFWGDISADDVIRLLAISDIFLYTSTRGACMPMAVLEAMASGCAVIATTQPLANTVALADGRGVIVQTGNVEETTAALVRLVCNPTQCRVIGKAARAYISVQHSPLIFRRMLQRVSFWSNLDDLLNLKKQTV